MSQKRPIRVLRLAPVLDFGGVESRFVMQCKNWDCDDVQVDYACFWKDGAAADKIRTLGGRVIVLGQDPAVRNPKATLALLRLLRREKYDVVHASIGEANFHAMLCARLGSWKTIIEETGIPQRSLRNRVIHGALYRLPHRIIGVSQAALNNIIDNEWAPVHKTQVIYNAIAPHFFDVKRAKPYDSNRVQFRSVGRLVEVKNLGFLIDVMAKVMLLHLNIYWEIVGEGPLRDALQAQIVRSGLEERITLKPFCNDVAALHATTDWLLMPSLTEGFSIAASEAMAAGIPVIASDGGGLPEVLDELSSDWMFSTNDIDAWAQGLVKAARMNPEDYQHLVHRVRTRATTLHPERYTRELQELYRTF